MFGSSKLLFNRVPYTRAFTTNSLCNIENRQKCLHQMSIATKRLSTEVASTESAAVLILLVNCDKPNVMPSILYTLRSHKLLKHTRQVSFPGGKHEPNDATHVDCALRETEEEIGIPRDRIVVWGETSALRFSKALSIVPVIGSMTNYDSSQLKVNSDEVERVFTVPITELCERRKHTQFRPTGWRHSTRPIARKSYSMPVFTVREERIWGITAVMTHMFLHSLLPDQSYHSQVPYVPTFK